MKPSIFGCGPPQALAVAGLSVLGRDRFGVFPLRGKLRNARRPRQLPEGLHCRVDLMGFCRDFMETYITWIYNSNFMGFYGDLIAFCGR